MKKSQANNFYETFKDSSDEIIVWAKREIVEYKKLIKLIENDKSLQKNKRTGSRD